MRTLSPGYPKLQLNCWPVTFTTSSFGLLRLQVVEHDPAVDRERRDEDERDRHPDDLEARVSVDRRAVAHVARAGAELVDGVDGHGHDEHEDRHGADQQHVVERVDVARRAGGAAGNQSIERQMAVPMTEATSPMAIIRPIGCFSPSIRGSSSGAAAGATGPCSLSRSESVTGARVYWTGRSGGEPARVSAKGRGRPSMVAPECLCELRGLAVAHGSGHAGDRQRAEQQQGGGPFHAHPLQLAPEARAAALGERALELPRGGGDRARDGSSA